MKEDYYSHSLLINECKNDLNTLIAYYPITYSSSVYISGNDEFDDIYISTMDDESLKEKFDYFKENYEVNIKCEEEGEEDSSYEEKFHMALLRLKENSSNKSTLFEGMKNIFKKENVEYYVNDVNTEEKFFNSYIGLPIMFVDRNIAVSDKVKNIRVDGNGNVDFSGMN